MNKYRKIIAKQAKSIRKAHGLTLGKFAELYNKSAPQDLEISLGLQFKYEKGEVAMPAEKYLKMLSLNPPGNILS